MSQSKIEKSEREELTRLRAENEILRTQNQDWEIKFNYALQNQTSGMLGHLALKLFLEEIKNQSPSAVFPITALVIDLKGFKSINDQYGHEVGDLALKHAGEHFRLVIRGGDKIFHLPQGKTEVFHPHGDEYVILFTSSNHRTAETVKKRLRNMPPMVYENQIIPIRCDIGIHSASTIEELSSLLHNADMKMYRNKRRAR